jgi:hypothetical protein
MSNLKYLMLFEAFQSNVISNLLKHIGSKIKSADSERFLIALKDILMNQYGFQIDKISNSDLKYLSAKQALKIKSEGEISNPFGVYALKFWFSIEEGYLGFTGVGDNEMKSNSLGFTESEIDYIKSELDIKTGTLVPLVDYKNLNTGDKVLGYYNDYEEYRYLALGTIFREDDRLWAIQDVADGGSSGNYDGWRQYGRYSWSLGEVEYPADDHCKLHLYKESTDKLNVVASEYNDLLVNRDGKLTLSRTAYSGSIKDIEKADFAIVIYIDGLIKDESVQDVRNWRKESRAGATALLTDQEIKKANFKRYMDKLITMYGLSLDTTEGDLRNLQNLVRTILCDKNIFFAFWLDTPSVDRIGKILKKIELLFKSDDKEYRFDSLRDQFKNYREDSKSANLRYEGSKKRVISKANENVLDIFNKIYEVSSKINDVILGQKIENIDDLEILQYKLELLQKFIKDGRIRFSENIEYALNNFHYNDGDVDRGVERSNDEDMSVNLRKIERIEKFLQTTFN